MGAFAPPSYTQLFCLKFFHTLLSFQMQIAFLKQTTIIPLPFTEHLSLVRHSDIVLSKVAKAESSITQVTT